MIPARFFQNNIWSPEFYDITRIKQKYAGRIGTLGENKRIHVRDGIQALWKKVYHIVDCTETERLICGKNGFGETVCLERAMVKPIIYNREFLPLKTINPDAYCLFPYEGAKNKDKMSINKIQELYPHTYDYLTRYEDKIKARVECNEGEYWHTFTREHNHEWFDSKKVIIPMTARDTFATYECNNGFYMDNSNVWFINIDQNDEVELKAITMIINSTVFSVFAKSGANPQSGGYFFRETQTFREITHYTCISIIKKAVRNYAVKYALLNGKGSLDDYDFTEYCIRDYAVNQEWGFANKLATLCNEVYFFHYQNEDDAFYYRTHRGKVYPIEKEICIDVIKPNIIRTEADIETYKEKAIFPYITNREVMSEEYLSGHYPMAYKFLLDNKLPLLERDKGKAKDYPVWFAYGRTQGMANQGKKLSAQQKEELLSLDYDRREKLIQRIYGIPV